MKKYASLIVLTSLLPLFSCHREVPQEAGQEEVSAKILRLSDEVSPEDFLLKFSQVPSAGELSAYEQAHGVTLQRALPSKPGKEEMERKHGLDRWYISSVPAETALDQMIRKVAADPAIQVVEYNSLAQRSGAPVVWPVASSLTKADFGIDFKDPYLNMQWHYKNIGDVGVSPTVMAGADINVVPVWKNLICGDPDIVIAVVDEGVKYSHPDLQDNMWVNSKEIPGNGVDDDGNGYIDDIYGYNFVDRGDISWAKAGDDGHGTHCAGTIAAVNNNGKGVAGVAGGSGNGDGCRLMSCQIFSGENGGYANTIAEAIKYAADNGASIISCSFGNRRQFNSDNAYYASSGIEIDAVHYFEDQCNNPVLNGNIAIFAAGNEAHDYAHYPGAFYDIISVSALGPDGLPAYYTNYGPGCNICAPGGEAYHYGEVGRWRASQVLSTLPSEIEDYGFSEGELKTGHDYGYMQGTSMACPHVSGVVALGLSYAKKLGKKFDRDEFKRMILASVNDVDQHISKVTQKTYAYHQSALQMAPFYHQMGTGCIDAWRLMMKIEGTPTSTAGLGKKQWIDLTSTFGSASVSLTYLSVAVPEETIEALGLQKLEGPKNDRYPSVPEGECYAYIQFGRLYLHPTKLGSGKIAITAVGGGDHLGGGDLPTGGMELEQDLSIIVRDNGGGNGTGGWL